MYQEEWMLENNINAFAGGVEEKNRYNQKGDIRVKLTGNVNFAGITIIYI